MRRVFCLLILLPLILLACEKKPENIDDKLVVVATSNLVADILKNIGGDFITIYDLVPNGIDPHQFKASEGDIVKLAGADIIFYNGLSLEGKLASVLERMERDVATVSITSTIPDSKLIKEFGAADPHVWLNPTLWIYAVNLVADTLVAFDPDNSVLYRNNEDIYVQELMALDIYAKERLDTVPVDKRILVTSHDAFSYLGDAYGWDVIGIQGVSSASETSVNSIQKLTGVIIDRKVSCIFTETSVSERFVDALKASTRAAGDVELRIGEPLYSDSLGPAGSEADSYIGMYKYDVNAIVSGILNE